MLKINDSNKSHLSFLLTLGTNVLADFCKLAWDYIVKGPNPKLYNSAAQKLSIEPQGLQHVVEALGNLLVESCKHKITLVRFQETLASLGFEDAQADVLCKFYKEKEVEINHVLLAGAVQLPTFKNIEWRVEAQLGTRAVADEISPRVLMKLSLDNSDCEGVLLQTDAGNLVHMTHILEQALHEATGQHMRRIQRRFKQS